MGIEQRALAAMLAAITRACGLLTDQLLPDVRHLDRVVAGLGHQPCAHCVGLGFHLAAVLEQRKQSSELSKLDVVAEIDARSSAPNSRSHRRDREDVGLAP